MDLHDAVAKGEMEKIKLMLGRHPNLLATEDKFGWQPLHWAFAKGQVEAAAFLIAQGANPFARSSQHGNTPLEVASQNFSKLKKLLPPQKADSHVKQIASRKGGGSSLGRSGPS